MRNTIIGAGLRSRTITRRSVLKGAAAGGLVLGTGTLFAPAVRAQTAIKVGYVSPQTGALAQFAEADDFVLTTMRELIGSGIETPGGVVPVEIVVRDSQSNPNRAAEVARELIVDEGISLMLVGGTPENTNPVSTQCEVEQVPCISTTAPWQPWYMGRQSNPASPVPFEYTYHFFWGLEDIIGTYASMWDQLDTNMSVGGLFPNDADGNAWGNPETGVGPGLAERGYTITDTGRFQNLTEDFSAQINAFRNANAEIVTGVIIPPDLATFWTQANQQGYRPKAVTLAKAILFPSSVEALGELGHNLSSEVWWTPNHPYTSSLTGQSGQEVAQGFTEFSGRPWTQPIGFAYALFEVAIDVLKRTADVSDYEAVAQSIRETNLQTLVGPVQWGKDTDLGPIASNVSKTPLVGGQWRRQDDGSFELVVVENVLAPDVPVSGEMEAIA